MKTTYKTILIALALCWVGTSCTPEDDLRPNAEEAIVPAHINDSVYHEEAKMMAYNFVYPSKDPFGKDVMLSATITLNDEVTRQSPARGLILYNHFTVYQADQCPTHGDLLMQKLMAPGKLITISPDYYGFGSTEEYPQAYCISRANAQSSVDALLAAKHLLDSMGYAWGDYLFNIGYSQGAQTAMGVVRLVDESYPDISISHTFAGAGPYDIPETYRQFLSSTITGMPSTVVSVLLSYNEYFQLNIPREAMFVEPLLSHIDEWVLSKKYTREEIDSKIGSQVIGDYLNSALFDTNSHNSQLLLQAMNSDNLCHGWTPRNDERIYLFHNTLDITVPVANTANLYQFLSRQGLNNVILDTADYGSSPLMPAHETGAAPFIIRSTDIMCQMLGVTPWISPQPTVW